MTKPPFFFPRDYADHERHVIAHADYFAAVDFRGRATYARKQCKTRAAAERAARTLIAQRDPSPANKGRPVLIYAVSGPHQVVAGQVRP